MKRIKIITLKGYQARISRDVKNNSDRLFISWHTPTGCPVFDWLHYKKELDALLLNVRNWADKNNFICWSY